MLILSLLLASTPDLDLLAFDVNLAASPTSGDAEAGIVRLPAPTGVEILADGSVGGSFLRPVVALVLTILLARLFRAVAVTPRSAAAAASDLSSEIAPAKHSSFAAVRRVSASPPDATDPNVSAVADIVNAYQYPQQLPALQQSVSCSITTARSAIR